MNKGELNFVSTFGNFSFWTNIEEGLIYGAANILGYLGYTKEENLTLETWSNKILHVSEKKTIKSILSSFSELKGENIVLGNYQLNLLHRMRKSDGNYIKILRVCRLMKVEVDSKDELHQYNLCFDITSLYKPNIVSFELESLNNDKSKLEIMGRKIKDRIPRKRIFTVRELEVLNIWARESSLESLASMLNITVRTAETHLKNMRKKVGVTRTVDVLEFARRTKML